jgi:hypothetical protein
MDQSVLSAYLRRSGAITRARARLLFWTMMQVRMSPPTIATPLSKGTADARDHAEEDDDDDDDGSSGGTKIAVENICAILLFCLSKRAPRFVFICGSNNTVLRSADRGRTFRRISVIATPSVVDSGEKQRKKAANDCSEGGTTADDATLKDIIRLLPNGAALREATGCGGDSAGANTDTGCDDAAVEDDAAQEAEDERDSTGSPEQQASTTSSSDVMSLAVFEDYVAICGSNGLVALSADRGVTYVSLPIAALLRASSRAKDRTRTPNAAVTIRGIAFCSPTTLLFHSTNSLLAADFTRLSLSQCAFFPVVRHLHEFDSAIGILSAKPLPAARFLKSGLQCGECIVSTAHMLHISYDCGITFLSIRHALGLVRCLLDLDNVLRPTDVPKLPQHQPQEKSHAASKKYSYTTECSLDSNNIKIARCRDAASPPAAVSAGDLAARLAERCPFRYASSGEGELGGDSGRYAVFAALSTCGKIVSYDFTSLLFIAVPDTRDKLYVSAANVDYVTFVQSGAADGVGLAVQAGPSEQEYSLIRSTSSGISRSVDLGRTWSAPIYAYMRSCRTVDDGCFIVCNSRKMVALSEDYGKIFTQIAIPQTALPTLYDVAIMD